MQYEIGVCAYTHISTCACLENKSPYPHQKLELFKQSSFAGLISACPRLLPILSSNMRDVPRMSVFLWQMQPM